jgi:peptidoglycan hydrolase-like protein with peptidoglycan-binding domain
VASSDQRQRHPVPSARSALVVSKINDKNLIDRIGLGIRGNAVVRAEILLDRLKFSPGEISDVYSRNVQNAVNAFQAAHSLPVNSEIDSTTWTALNQHQPFTSKQEPQNGKKQRDEQSTSHDRSATNSPPRAIIPYVISGEDVACPFTKIPHVIGQNMEERLLLREAILKNLNYKSPLELLAEKFHSSPRLLVELNAGKTFSKAGTEIQLPAVDSPPPEEAASVVVDASTHTVTALSTEGRLLSSYPATMGSVHNPLPSGSFKIVSVNWYPHFKYNPKLFWDAENKNPRAILPLGLTDLSALCGSAFRRRIMGFTERPSPLKSASPSPTDAFV